MFGTDYHKNCQKVNFLFTKIFDVDFDYIV